MTTRVQEKGFLQPSAQHREARMGLLEKSMLRRAVFDPADRVLDANVCNGQVAEYLLHHMECRVCGVSDRMEEVRRTRARMRSGDFVYAAVGDIPWQDDTFDTVLLHPEDCTSEALGSQLAECRRVLKPGGQLVLGLKSPSAAVRKLKQLLLECPLEEEIPTPAAARQLLAATGYEYITKERAGLGGVVFIAWKSSPVNP